MLRFPQEKNAQRSINRHNQFDIKQTIKGQWSLGKDMKNSIDTYYTIFWEPLADFSIEAFLTGVTLVNFLCHPFFSWQQVPKFVHRHWQGAYWQGQFPTSSAWRHLWERVDSFSNHCVPTDKALAAWWTPHQHHPRILWWWLNRSRLWQQMCKS